MLATHICAGTMNFLLISNSTLNISLCYEFYTNSEGKCLNPSQLCTGSLKFGQQ